MTWHELFNNLRLAMAQAHLCLDDAEYESFLDEAINEAEMRLAQLRPEDECDFGDDEGDDDCRNDLRDFYDLREKDELP